MRYTFADFFAGIGGFHWAALRAAESLNLEAECVAACEIARWPAFNYKQNFDVTPLRDITQIDIAQLPEFDLCFGGFPCQPFSTMGHRKGEADHRFSPFASLANIVKQKQPKAFVFENVPAILSHTETFAHIRETLESAGYRVDYKVLNALDFQVPQSRKRVYIQRISKDLIDDQFEFAWPEPIAARKGIADILEPNPPTEETRFTAYTQARLDAARLPGDDFGRKQNWFFKSGAVRRTDYAPTLLARDSAVRQNMNGERAYSKRELARLQGFPDSHSFADIPKTAWRHCVGNAVSVPCAEAVIRCLLASLSR